MEQSTRVDGSEESNESNNESESYEGGDGFDGFDLGDRVSCHHIYRKRVM